MFRYHRERAGVPAGHPHALRHSFGTALAEAGVDLSVIQALMGHDHVDSSAAYIHLAPSFLREEFDAARARLRTRPEVDLLDRPVSARTAARLGLRGVNQDKAARRSCAAGPTRSPGPMSRWRPGWRCRRGLVVPDVPAARRASASGL